MIIKKGTESVSVYFKLIDPATGAPETGLTITDLDLTYVRDGATAVKADLTELDAVDSAYAANKAKEVDGTNCPGLYRVDVPNAALVTGVNRVQLCVNGAAIDPAYMEVELVNYDPADGVRLGLTALPNAVPGAENGIFIAGSNAATSITSSSGSALTITSSGGNGCGIIVAGNGSGSGIKSTGGTSGHGIEAILGGGMGTYAIQCNTGSINTASLIGNIVGTISAVASVGAGGIASTSFATGAITAAAIAANAIGASELAADAVAEIADAVWDEASTGHTDAGKAGQQLWTDLDAVLADTGELQTDWVNGGRLDLLIDGIKTKTDYLPSATAGQAGGVFIAGTNAPVTITGSGNALTLQSTGANGNGLFLVGNGSGDGMYSSGGVTGHGIYSIGGLVSGSGIYAVAGQEGHGIYGYGTGGASYFGMKLDSAQSVGLSCATFVVPGVTTFTGAVTCTAGITGDITGSLSGSVGSVAAGGIAAASFADGAITAAAIADAAIDNATFAADVGSTAYATNIIALAVRKVLDELNLDHLSKVPVNSNADMTTEVPDGTVLSNLMTRTGDTSDYAYDTDSLEGLADGASGGGATAQEVWEYATRTLTAATNITDGIADAVWDEASTGHTDAGKAGAQLWTAVDAILADTDELQTDWADGGRLDVLLDAASPGSAGYEVTVTVRTTAGVAISNAMVWASTSSTGSPASEVHYTAANGVATFHLTNGTWYFLASGAGYTYDNSSNTVTVSGAATSGTFDIGTLIDTALSQTGADSDAFLYRAVNRVRMLTDEPETNAKYSINELVDLIQESHVDILQEVQRVANTPIIATYTFTYSSSVTTYVLPSTVGRVVAIGEISATSGYREFYTSRSRLNAYGKGVKVEGNVISFQGTNYLQNGTTVTVEYEVSGCAKLYTASTTTFTATTLTAGDALLGTRDTRPYSYLGCVLRILPNSGNPVEQERIITGQSGDTYNVYTVSEAFSPALSGTVMYEINPPFSKGFDQVVPTQAAMTIAANEGNATRMKTLEVLYNRQIRTLAQMAGHRDGMQGSLNRTDGAFNRRGSRWRNGFVS